MVNRTQDFEDALFNELKERLRYRPVFRNTKPNDPCESFTTSLKLNCESCNSMWTSDNETTQFVYSMDYQHQSIYVKILITPQTCKSCLRPANISIFEDEIYRLAEVFVDMLEIKMIHRKIRKQTDQTDSDDKHIRSECEACSHGDCADMNNRKRIVKMYRVKNSDRS